MARWQTLYEWANEEFGDMQPSASTLQNYAKSNMIFRQLKRWAGAGWLKKEPDM